MSYERVAGLCEGASPDVREGFPVFRQRGVAMGTEEQEQIALFAWIELMSAAHPVLKSAYHVPNGGKRSKAEAARLKAAGVRAGVPDICLPCAVGGYHSLYIELKAGRNTPSDHQKEWLRRLIQQGHYACVCYGWSMAAAVIESYINSTIK